MARPQAEGDLGRAMVRFLMAAPLGSGALYAWVWAAGVQHLERGYQKWQVVALGVGFFLVGFVLAVASVKSWMQRGGWGRWAVLGTAVYAGLGVWVNSLR